MNNSRKLRIITAFISLVILFTSIQETYGKYKTDATGTTNMSIARWKIIINNQDVISNNYITNTLTPYFVGNSHIADNVIAPTSVGYFDVDIDCSAVDVSFEYTISTEIDELSIVDDIKVIGYSIDGGAIVDVDGTLTDLNEIVLHSNPDKTRNIRIYITWDDGAEATMDNINDTLAALADQTAKLNVFVNFTQITS